VLTYEKFGAEVAAGLLVGHQAQDHIARRRRFAGLRAHECGEHHRHAALHVEGAATPYVAIAQLAGKRLVLPLPARGDDIDMALQQ
jgi:hypothetical protein